MTAHRATHTPSMIALTEKSEAAPACNTLLFYQAGHLVTEISNKRIRHIMRSQDTALAQSDQGTAVQPLQVDHANSVLNRAPNKTTYSAYGFFKEGTSTAVLAFNGQRFDPATKTYALGNGNRNYHPTLFRFSSPDPFSPFDQGGLHPYAYCENDPINKMDPSGNVPRFMRSFFKGAANRLHLRTPGNKNPQVILEKFNPSSSSPLSIPKRPLPNRPSGERLAEGSGLGNAGHRARINNGIEEILLSQKAEAQITLSHFLEESALAYSILKRRQAQRLSSEAERKRFIQISKKTARMTSRINDIEKSLESIRRSAD